MSNDKPLFSHIPQGTGEDYIDYLERIICTWAVHDGKCNPERVKHVLLHLAVESYADGRANGPKETERKLRARISELVRENDALAETVHLGVSKIDAEEGRRKGAVGIREKAAAMAEEIDGSPTALSEAIRALPLPRTLWTETRRPGDTTS